MGANSSTAGATAESWVGPMRAQRDPDGFGVEESKEEPEPDSIDSELMLAPDSINLLELRQAERLAAARHRARHTAERLAAARQCVGRQRAVRRLGAALRCAFAKEQLAEARSERAHARARKRARTRMRACARARKLSETTLAATHRAHVHNAFALIEDLARRVGCSRLRVTPPPRPALPLTPTPLAELAKNPGP